jgi:hypothetical protein
MIFLSLVTLILLQATNYTIFKSIFPVIFVLEYHVPSIKVVRLWVVSVIKEFINVKLPMILSDLYNSTNKKIKDLEMKKLMKNTFEKFNLYLQKIIYKLLIITRFIVEVSLELCIAYLLGYTSLFPYLLSTLNKFRRYFTIDTYILLKDVLTLLLEFSEIELYQMLIILKKYNRSFYFIVALFWDFINIYSILTFNVKDVFEFLGIAFLKKELYRLTNLTNYKSVILKVVLESINFIENFFDSLTKIFVSIDTYIKNIILSLIIVEQNKNIPITANEETVINVT